MAVKRDFNQELQALYERLLEMGGLAERAVAASVQSLIELDAERAKGVIRNDTHVDIMEMEIEQRSVHLLSQFKPHPSELRLLSTITKVVTDLERIADNAENIAEITLRLGQRRLTRPPADISKMAALSIEMLHDSLQALIQRDQALAREVCKRDDQVDDLYSEVFKTLVSMMQGDNDEEKISQWANLLFVARFLERIADHSTNICERVVYLVTGKLERLG